MKIWLDDLRDAPDKDWVICRSVNEFIAVATSASLEETAESFEMSEVSLDHDLGEYFEDGGDGFRAVLWMAEFDKWPRLITVHSANPVGSSRMLSDIDRYAGYTRNVDYRTRSERVANTQE